MSTQEALAKTLCDHESHRGWDNAPPGLKMHYLELADKVLTQLNRPKRWWHR